MARSTPIVIQLKKRTAPGPGPPAHDEEGGNGSAPPPPGGDRAPYDPLKEAGGRVLRSGSPPPRPPSSGGRSRSRSRSRSGSGSKTKDPRSPSPAAGMTTLASYLSSFQGEVDTFMRQKSERLEEQVAGFADEERKRFQETYNLVHGFLEEYGGLPAGEGIKDSKASDASDAEDDEAGGASGSEDEKSDSSAKSGKDEAKPRKRRRKAAAAGTRQRKGGDEEPDRDKFSKSLVPEITKFIVEDQGALQDARELLTTFTERHYKKDKDLVELVKKPSPAPLLKGLLRVLVSELGLGQSEKEKGRDRDRDKRDPSKDRRDPSRDRREPSRRDPSRDRREPSRRDPSKGRSRR